MINPRNYKHGMARTSTYVCWQDMKNRCYNPNVKAYKHYGGRGITVCDRWLDSENGFINFLNDMGEKPKGLSIDRIDVNGNYEPSNCRWATASQQSINKRPKHQYLGIRKRCGSYEVSCCHKYIGTFKTLEEAIYHRKLAEKELVK